MASPTTREDGGQESLASSIRSLQTTKNGKGLLDRVKGVRRSRERRSRRGRSTKATWRATWQRTQGARHAAACLKKTTLTCGVHMSVRGGRDKGKKSWAAAG